MTEKQRVTKIKQMLEAERGQPLKMWYLSFAGNERVAPPAMEFLGGCYIRATGMTTAIHQAHALGINPGGEVLAIELPDSAAYRIRREYENRLLTKDEVETAAYGSNPNIDAWLEKHGARNIGVGRKQVGPGKFVYRTMCSDPVVMAEAQASGVDLMQMLKELPFGEGETIIEAIDGLEMVIGTWKFGEASTTKKSEAKKLMMGLMDRTMEVFRPPPMPSDEFTAAMHAPWHMAPRPDLIEAAIPTMLGQDNVGRYALLLALFDTHPELPAWEAVQGELEKARAYIAGYPEDGPGWNDYHMVDWLIRGDVVALEELKRRYRLPDGPVGSSARWMIDSMKQQIPAFAAEFDRESNLAS